MSAAITLDELETLQLPDDVPDDARVTITAAELRALVELVPAARELTAVFGTHHAAPEDRVHAG